MPKYRVTAGRKLWETGYAYVEANSLDEADRLSLELEAKDFEWVTDDFAENHEITDLDPA